MALSRRALFLSLPALAANRGQVYPPDRARFSDSATEFEVVRLTNPSYASFLPPSWNRCSSSRGGFLIYSSDRGGSLQVFRMDVRGGESRQITEAAALQPDSVVLSADDRAVFFFDGGTAKTVQLSGLREKTLGEGDASRGLSVSEEGLLAAYFRGPQLVVANAAKGDSRVIAETGAQARTPLVRPKRASVLYQSEGAVWLASFDGSGENRRLKTAPDPQCVQWSPDGRTILYLSGTELREHTPDTNADAPLAKTSAFASFGRNGDASVFVGASRSKAGPYILLLLRITRRELAICEHRCSDPSLVHPAFSPSSQRIYFQSDRNGKMALYTMAVEKLVEKTES